MCMYVHTMWVFVHTYVSPVEFYTTVCRYGGIEYVCLGAIQVYTSMCL